MIWIDSSFAVEWLSGTARAEKVKLTGDPLGILPMQYTEILVFYLRQGIDVIPITNELEHLELIHPQKEDLGHAGMLYVRARKNHSKASLADALLAAVAHKRNEKILAFDHDFADLGMKQKGGFWSF